MLKKISWHLNLRQIVGMFAQGRTLRRTGYDLVQRSPGCDEACCAHAEKLLHGAKSSCLSNFENCGVGRWNLLLRGHVSFRRCMIWIEMMSCYESSMIVLQILQFETPYFWYHQSQQAFFPFSTFLMQGHRQLLALWVEKQSCCWLCWFRLLHLCAEKRSQSRKLCHRQQLVEGTHASCVECEFKFHSTCNSNDQSIMRNLRCKWFFAKQAVWYRYFLLIWSL